MPNSRPSLIQKQWFKNNPALDFVVYGKNENLQQNYMQNLVDLFNKKNIILIIWKGNSAPKDYVPIVPTYKEYCLLPTLKCRTVFGP